MEGRRAPNLFALGKLALMQNFNLKMRGPSKCLIVSPMKKNVNCEHRRVGKITSGIAAFVVVSRFLPCIFGSLSCVFGEPAIVRSCSTLGVFWTSFRHDFQCFLMSRVDFRGFGASAVLLFRTAQRQVHTFVPIGATRRPTLQQMGSPSRFFPPCGVGFRTTFWYFFVFFRNFAIL